MTAPNPKGPSDEVRALSHIAIKKRRAATIDALTELVAEGVPLKEAGARIGISGASATTMMRDVRAKFGWQAS